MVKRELWSRKLVNSWLMTMENNSSNNSSNKKVAPRLRWVVLVRRRRPVPPNNKRRNFPKRSVVFPKLKQSLVLQVVDSTRTILNS